MKKQLVMTSCVVLILVIGCQDLPTRPQPERARFEAGEIGTTVAPAAEDALSSTICQAYRGRLLALEQELAAGPENPDLLGKVGGLREFVSDICG